METITKTVNKRKIVSLMLLATFIMMPTSAVYIHVTHGTETSHNWLHIHVLFGAIFMVVGIYHIVYNWRVLKHYWIGKNNETRINPKNRESIILTNTKNCKACWECINVCPKQVIGKVSFLWHKHIIIRNGANCIGCKKCIQICPYGVFVETNKII
ncbi:MAG: 4Fe-4S binding protein [Helicobacteraceae bacterium]|jgi:2-oxoglutarate ferredoxin oxidoreductase subunit delta|nr:4Fe-4S binding protein [Helicobacteraceae bacterium]